MMKEEKKENIKEDIDIDLDLEIEDEEDVDVEYNEEEILKGIKGTPETKDSIKQYLYEIGQFPLLSVEEEHALGERIKEGDEVARNELANANLRLVVSIAKRFVSSGVPFQDLIQEGNLGLLKATQMFDVDKGYKFSTYATWWIRQGIQRSIYDSGRLIRKPVHIEESLRKVNTYIRQQEQITGNMPSVEEISKNTGIDKSKVKELLSYNSSIVSMDTPIGEEEDSLLGDFIPDSKASVESEIMSKELHQDLISAMSACLTAKEQAVIRMRFGIDGTGRYKTLEECGSYFGVTRERIRQIEAKAIRKLKKSRSSRVYLAGYRDDLKDRGVEKTYGRRSF